MKNNSDALKSVIFVALSLVVILGAYLLVVSPKLDECSVLNDDIETLDKKYKELKTKEKNKKNYEAETEEYEADFEDTLNMFPSEITQENSIMFLSGVEDRYEFAVEAVTLGQPTIFYTLAADSSVVGTNTNFAVEYKGTVNGVKEFLYYIKQYNWRTTIDSMELKFNDEEKILEGTMSLNMYAVTGEDRTTERAAIDKVDIGSNNIFDPSDTSVGSNSLQSPYSSTDGEGIKDDYDQFVLLQSPFSDSSAVIIGNSDEDTSKYVQSNENAVQNVTIRYFMKDDKYYVSYSIGDKTYPAEFDDGSEFDPGENLNLLVMSSAKDGTDDKMSVKATVINNTDKVLNVKVVNEDQNDGRFNIVSKEGNIIVFK